MTPAAGRQGVALTATAGGRTLVRACQSAGSYLSASDKRVHFGLGTATKVGKLTVRWPNGKVTTLTDVAADRYVEVPEP